LSNLFIGDNRRRNRRRTVERGGVACARGGDVGVCFDEIKIGEETNTGRE